jgi:hypothetical protein
VIINIESRFHADFDTFVSLLKQSSTLRNVSHPLITFYPEAPGFPEIWSAGEYRARMKLFGVLPFGNQTIRIEEITGFGSGEYILRDNGFGDSAPRWDHWMIVRKTEREELLQYIDRVEVKAGALTPPVALFAALFYSWRQVRWRYLIRTRRE